MPALSIKDYDVSIEGAQISNINKLNMHIELRNGCNFKSVGTTADGKTKYDLQRGPFVQFGNEREKDITLEIMNVEGGDNQASIDKLYAYLKETKKKGVHAEYAKNITICALNAAGEKTFSVNFTGCVTNVENMPASGVKYAQLKVTLSMTNIGALKFGI